MAREGVRGFGDRMLPADLLLIQPPDTFVTRNPNPMFSSATPRALAILKNSKAFAVSLLQPRLFSQHAWSRIQQFTSRFTGWVRLPEARDKKMDARLY